MSRNWTLADDHTGRTTVEVAVVGKRPKHRPYLRIGRIDGNPTSELIASIDNANALRGLAHRILRALGDE